MGEQNLEELEKWYTASGAAAVLSQKRDGKKVAPDYLRSLAREGKVRTKKIGPRTTLYFKEDVDGYTVEERGNKAARAAKARAGVPKSLARGDETSSLSE